MMHTKPIKKHILFLASLSPNLAEELSIALLMELSQPRRFTMLAYKEVFAR